MKKKLKTNKNKIIFIIIFLLLCFWISFLPMVGDDWGWGKSFTIITSIKEALALWSNYNGRVLGHILVFLMSTYPIFKTIIISVTFTTLIYIISSLSTKDKKNKIWIIGILLIIGMPFTIYREVFAWMSGFSNFGIPVLCMIIYIYLNRYIFEIKEFKKNKNNKWLLTFLLGLFMNLFSEHSAIFSVILGIGIIIITYIFQKTFVKTQISFLIGSIIGCTLMFASPTYWGTMLREVGTAMENMNVFEKIIYNIKNSTWFSDICINNILSNAFLTILFISNIKKSNNKYKISTIILFILTFIICPIIVYGNLTINYIYQIIITTIIVSCVIFNIYQLYYKKQKNNFYKISLLYIVSYIAAAPLLAAVGFGPRCFINSYVLQCMSIAIIYSTKNIKINKKIIYLLLFTLLSIRLFATGLNYHALKEREKIINNINEKKEITIERLPLWMYVHQSGIPASSYHEDMFKKYYKINKDIRIIISY